MKKRLFLTGAANCGKSAFLKTMLGERMQSAGGFVTEKRFDKNGKICAEFLMPAAAAAGVEGFDALPFIDYSSAYPRTANDVFRNLGTQLIQEAIYYPFTVLDEFGGIDMLIPQYRSALEDFFNSDAACIGVLKSKEEIRKLKDELGLTERFIFMTDNLHDELSADENTLILPTTGKGDIKALRIIQQWVAEYT
ncbi:MAG: hypothetical protein IJC39_05410 [Firmicutes bacterium]|nr:hypothetical protein [Bacillota bacterium]